MDAIHLTVRGHMEETVELTVGDRPRLKVSGFASETTVDPDPAAVVKIVEALVSLRLPATPSDSLQGLDGFTYTLRFTHGNAASEYSWWSEPPSDWKPLGKIVKQLIALSGRRISSTGY